MDQTSAAKGKHKSRIDRSSIQGSFTEEAPVSNLKDVDEGLRLVALAVTFCSPGVKLAHSKFLWQRNDRISNTCSSTSSFMYY